MQTKQCVIILKAFVIVPLYSVSRNKHFMFHNLLHLYTLFRPRRRRQGTCPVLLSHKVAQKITKVKVINII